LSFAPFHSAFAGTSAACTTGTDALAVTWRFAVARRDTGEVTARWRSSTAVARSPWKNCADCPIPLDFTALVDTARARELEPFAELTVRVLTATRVAAAEAVMADMTIAKDLFFGEVGKTTTTTKGRSS